MFSFLFPFEQMVGLFWSPLHYGNRLASGDVSQCGLRSPRWSFYSASQIIRAQTIDPSVWNDKAFRFRNEREGGKKSKLEGTALTTSHSKTEFISISMQDGRRSGAQEFGLEFSALRPCGAAAANVPLTRRPKARSHVGVGGS